MSFKGLSVKVPLDTTTGEPSYLACLSGQNTAGEKRHWAMKSTGNTHLEYEDLSTSLNGIQEQNEDALSQFYDLTINRVYGLALRITGQTEEAEEVVSDVYLQVWEQAGRYQTEKGRIMTWLLTICRSRAIDRLRKKWQSEREVSASEYPDAGDLTISPEYFISALQKKSLVYEAVQKLSSTQQQILALAFFRGMSYPEISKFIDMPLGTVKSHVRRGLNELKSELTLKSCSSSGGGAA